MANAQILSPAVTGVPAGPQTLVRQAVARHIWLGVVIVAALIVSALWVQAIGAPYAFEQDDMVLRWLSYAAPGLILSLGLRVWLYPPAVRARAMGEAVNALVAIGLLFLLVGNYTAVKPLLPIGQTGIAWDRVFADLDARIFGEDAWRVGASVTHHPAMLKLLETAYWFWFVVIFLTVMHAALSHDLVSRSGLLVGFALTWTVGGLLLADLFASAGPVYYADLGLGDRFADLVAALHRAEAAGYLQTHQAQHWLWDGHLGHIEDIGISAMPSMHVASSMLVLLYVRAVWPTRAWLAAVFFGLVAVASVALGWHYAADGIAAMLVASLAWKIGTASGRRLDPALTSCG